MVDQCRQPVRARLVAMFESKMLAPKTEWWQLFGHPGATFHIKTTH